MKTYTVALMHRHFAALVKLAGLENSPNAFEIGQRMYKRLLSVEREAHKAAEDYCNLPNFDWEKATDKARGKVERIFNGKLPAGFFVNGDPRGYALKINAGNEAGMEYHPEYIPAGLHKDWGGYGILAPDEF